MLHLVFHACIFHQEKKKKRTPSQVLVLYLCNLIKPRNQNLALSFIDSHIGNIEKLPKKFTVFPRLLISNHVPASCINPHAEFFSFGIILPVLSETKRYLKG